MMLRTIFLLGLLVLNPTSTWANSHCQDLLSHFLNIKTVSRNLKADELRTLAINVGAKYKSEIIESLKKAKPSETGRVYEKVFENSYITIWAIKWDNNSTGIHDHLESQTGISVLEGTIQEEYFTPPKSIPTKRTIAAGSAVGLRGTPYVHRISGHGVSLHIYSPPLTKMTNYEIDSKGLLVPNGQWKDEEP